MPQAGPARAADPAQRLKRPVHSAAGVQLPLGEVWRPTTYRQHHEPRPDGVQSGELKVSLKRPSCIVHSLGNGVRAHELAQAVDVPVAGNYATFGIRRAHLLELAA